MRRFFDEMAGLMRISGWSPDEYLEIVKIGLKGGAATWLKAVPRDDQDSLEKVKAIIKEAFGDKRPRWQRHQRFTQSTARKRTVCARLCTQDKRICLTRRRG